MDRSSGRPGTTAATWRGTGPYPASGPALTPGSGPALTPPQDRPLPRLRTGALADAAHQHLEEGLGWRHQRFARAPPHPQLPLGVWLGERKARTLTAGGQPRQHEI